MITFINASVAATLLEQRLEKNSGSEPDLNPRPLQCWCSALPTELSKPQATCILYYCAAAGPGCLINCCKLCCFLARKLNEVQCQFIDLRCGYCYCFVYILYRLLNKQLRQLPRNRSLSENRSYHISINKQRFCEQNNCCLPSLCHFTRNKCCTVSI